MDGKNMTNPNQLQVQKQVATNNEFEVIDKKSVYEIERDEARLHLFDLKKSQVKILGNNENDLEAYLLANKRNISIKDKVIIAKKRDEIRKLVFDQSKKGIKDNANAFNYEYLAKEIAGKNAADKKGIKLREAIIEKARKENSEKLLLAVELTEKVADYNKGNENVENTVDFAQINKYSDEKLKEVLKEFKSFAYADLAAYKSDRDFVKNYTAVLNEIDAQIEKGYAVRRYYYENKLKASAEKDCLNAMAKTATLDRIKKYMVLRAELIKSPYYSLIDSKTLFSLTQEHIEQKMEAAKAANNPNLAVFLGVLAQIKLLGFKPDGTGRRDIEADIYKNNKDAWKAEREKVSEYVRLEKEVRKTQAHIKNLDIEIEINENKTLEIEKNKKKKEEQEKAFAELTKSEQQKVRNEIKSNREDWLKRIDEYAKGQGWTLNFDAYKENLLQHLAINMFSKKQLTKDKDDKFLQAIELFNNRIKQKEQQIDAAMENNYRLKIITCELPSLKTRVKEDLINLMLEKDVLLVPEEQFDLDSLLTEDFYISHRDDKMVSHYKTISLEFPELSSNKDIWNSIVTEKLLRLDDDKFNAEIEELSAQAQFYDGVIRSIIAEAFEDKQIHPNMRNTVYKIVKQELGANAYLAPINQVVFQTHAILNNKNKWYHINKTDIEINNSPATEEEAKKWETTKYRNPILALRLNLFRTMPLLREVYNKSEHELADYVLLAMRTCPDVISVYPEAATFKNVDAISSLTHRDLIKIMRVLSDNLVKSIDSFNTRKATLSEEVKKYAVAKMMAGSFTDEDIKEAIRAGEAKEKLKKEEQEQSKKALVSRFCSADIKSKAPKYNFGRIQGVHLFAKQILGIDVREAEFKVPGRFEKIKKAQEIWKKIDEDNATEKVLKAISASTDESEIAKIFDKYGEVTEDIYDELLLCGCSSELFSVGGAGEKYIYAYDDRDYKGGMRKFNYVVPRLLKIEEVIKERIDKAKQEAEDQYLFVSSDMLNAYRDTFRTLAAGLKPLEGLNETEVAEARRYNYEKFGVESFEDAIEVFKNTSDDQLDYAGRDLDLRIESLRNYKDGLFVPILSNLIENPEILKQLASTDLPATGDYSLAQELEAKFAPFLRAIAIASGSVKADRKKGEQVGLQTPFALSQYINNNFAIIYKSCTENPGTVNEWGKAISEYANMLFSTEIEGRGSVDNIVLNSCERAARIDKKRGAAIAMHLLETDADAFTTMLEGTKEFEAYFKDKLKQFMANEAVLEKYLKAQKADERMRGKILGDFENKLSTNMYLSYSESDFNKLIEDTREAYPTLFETEKDRIKREKAVDARNKYLQKYKDEADAKKAEGIAKDKDFKTLLKLEESMQKNPYLYLSAKNIKSVRSGDGNGKVKYFNQEEAAAYLIKIEDALKYMKHENELPDTLKAFMAEVYFANSSMDIYQALRYVIGAYRSMSDYYKHSKAKEEAIFADKQAIIERAVIYTYINEKDLTIPKDSKLILKYQKDEKAPLEKLVQKKVTTDDDEYHNLSDDEKITKYYKERFKGEISERYKIENLNDSDRKNILSVIKDMRKQKVDELNEKYKKEYDEEKAKRKKLAENEKFENKHPEYCIPEFSIAKFSDSRQSFEKIYKLNAMLQKQLSGGEITDPALLSEYRFFLKNIQMSVYGMKPEEFETFANRRLAYFKYSQKVRDVLKKEMNGVNKFTSDAYEGFCEYYRADIVKDLESKTEFDATAWMWKIRNDVYDDNVYRSVRANKVSFDDSLGRTRFYENQSSLSDITKMIYDSQSDEYMKAYGAMSSEEKVLFAAALSLADTSEEKTFTTADMISKDGGAGYSLEDIKSAFEEYIKKGELKLNIDYDAALYNLKNNSKSEPGVMKKLFNMEQKPVINEIAFKAALSIVESVKAIKAEIDGLDLETLGNSMVSYAYSKNHHLEQASIIDDSRINKMSDFMTQLVGLSKEDMIRKGQNSNYDALMEKGHNFVEGVNIAELSARLSSLSDDEKSLFVTILQDRTVLDYKSENRAKKFRDGEIIAHVNEQKRDLIKSEFISSSANRYNLVKNASSAESLNNAFKTLLSFQLRDGVNVDGTMRNHFESSSINRTTLLDWELIKRAFDYIDELKREDARVSIVKKAGDLIDYAGNQKAINVYEKTIKDEEFELETEEDFLAIFESEEIKAELVDEEHKAMLQGFKLLTPQQKMLFMRALQNREVLDISKKNSVKNLVLGTERDYVNAPARYALIDEYVKRSRSNKAVIDDKIGLYKSAFKSLLSTQINDDLDFLKVAGKDIKSLFSSEGLFSSSRRNTAIDWKLFGNALQFVSRAENEKKITYEDAELHRLLGKLSTNGDFNFNPAFMRKNIHTTGGRLSNYTASRVRNIVKKYIPDTGNLRILLSFVLNVDTMNGLNKSGFLFKAGETGQLNNQYVEKYKAEQLEKKKAKAETEKAGASKEAKKEEVVEEKNDKIEEVVTDQLDAPEINKEEAGKTEELPKEFEIETEPDSEFVTANFNIPTTLLPNADLEKLLERMKEYIGLKDDRLDGQSVSASVVKYESNSIPTITLSVKTIGAHEQEFYTKIKEEFVRQKRIAEQDAPKNGYGMTEAQVMDVLAENSGLKEYTQMSEVITAITDTIGLEGLDPVVIKNIEALKNANSEIKNLITLMESDVSLREKLLNSSFDSVMGLAVVIGEDAGYGDTMSKIKTHYENASKLKESVNKAVTAFLSDKDIISKLSEVQLGSVIGIIGKYTKFEYMDLLQKTADSIQGAGLKLAQAIIKYNEKPLIEGDKSFFNLDQNMMEQLGVDAMFDLVSEYTTYFDKTGKSTTVTDNLKKVADSVGKAIFVQLKKDKAIDKAKERLAAAAKAYEKKKATNEYKNMTVEEKADAEKEYQASIAADESIIKVADVNSAAELMESLDVSSVFKIASVFIKEDYAVSAEKRGTQLNLLKDQVAALMKQFNTASDTQNIVAAINLDKILEAANLEANGSKIKIGAQFVANSAKLLSNGFAVGLKWKADNSKDLVIGGVTIRKAGESKTELINDEGKKQDRSAEDVLNQYGIDEIFEITKVVGLLDPTGNAPKYITATQNIKTEVVKVVDKVRTALKSGGFDAWNKATDLDSCLNVLGEALKLNSKTEAAVNLTDALKEVNKVKNEVTGIYTAMAKDGDFFEKLNSLEIVGLVDLTKKFDKDGFVATIGNTLSIAKEMYNASYGLYYQGVGFYKGLEYMIASGKVTLPEDTATKIFNNFKDNKLFGGTISKLYENGKLLDAVKAGMIIKDSLSSFTNVVNLSLGLNELRKNAYGMELEFKDMQDEIELQKAKQRENKLLKGSNVKLSESEKKLSESAKDRNLFMTKEGVTYARNGEIAGLVAEAVNIVGNVSKVTFDPTGITKNLLIETAEFVKFITMILTDNAALDDYFKKGPGAEKIAQLAKMHMDEGNPTVDEKQLIKEAKIALGFGDVMELRTFVGKNIINSVLFSASAYNPLEGTKARAVAILKSIGLSDIIGQTDTAAANMVFNKLLGNYGMN